MNGVPRSRAELAAIEWEVLMRDADVTPDELRAFAAWHDGAAEHAAAWASLQCRLGAMGGRGGAGRGRDDGDYGHGVSGAGRTSGIRRDADAGDAAAVACALRQPSLERRRALRASFGMALLAVSGAGSWRLAHELGFDATWRSATGVRGAGVLADGSPLRFDAASRIDLAAAPRIGAAGETRAASAGTVRPGAAAASDGARLVVRQGQLLVQARGPVAVAVAGADIACTGAELCAGRLGRRGIVSVRDGAATLRLAGGRAIALSAGDTYSFAGAEAEPSPLSFDAAAAWTRGMLVADRLPLPDLFDAYSRYHTDIVRVTGAATTRVVSGVFRLADLEGALRQTASALPVTVQRYGFLTIVG